MVDLPLELTMTTLLEQAISQIKNLPESEQDEYAKMILNKLKNDKKLTRLWRKIDELGEDSQAASMKEITAMVKEVRHKNTEP
jgi:hypothetical protein